MKKTTTKKSNSSKKKFSEDELRRKKEQRQQVKEIRDIFHRIGFSHIKGIEGKEYKFDGRTSELDDIFVCENIIVLTEYTIGDPHLLKKKPIYDKINSNTRAFIEYLLKENIYENFSDLYCNDISKKYSLNQLQLRIVYCSKKEIDEEHKECVKDVIYFDYHIVKYFHSLSLVIKRSSIYEFLDFLNIKEELFGDNISVSESVYSYYGCNILPEENSFYAKGYKIISFYIDAVSLIQRAYVLRNEGWRNNEHIGFYQRMLDSKKIISMRKYLAEQKRVFVNNIIATISEKDIAIYSDENKSERISLDENGNFIGNNKITKVTHAYIEIPNKCNIIGLIDGQHRTFAYYEGADQYEIEIEQLRKRQNLLVTGVIFPKCVGDEERLKFEANLFLEINSTQKKVGSNIQQEIQMHTQPFASIAIGKSIISHINKRGPIKNMIEVYSFQKGKIKTASIVSFGLKPLIKVDNLKNDTLFFAWSDRQKNNLLKPDCKDYDLREEYIKYCTAEINQLFSAFKSCLDTSKWHPYSNTTKQGVLTVTFINGMLNLIRLLIENNQLNGLEYYKSRLKNIDNFDIKRYKSSQYRKLGEALYNEYFSG